jgi:cobalamin synthase
VPSLPAGILPLDSLTDICDWLGTYRERLRMARDDEQIGTIGAGMPARYHLGSAESA